VVWGIAGAMGRLPVKSAANTGMATFVSFTLFVAMSGANKCKDRCWLSGPVRVVGMAAMVVAVVQPHH
jgi:hypothetical protein